MPSVFVISNDTTTETAIVCSILKKFNIEYTEISNQASPGQISQLLQPNDQVIIVVGDGSIPLEGRLLTIFEDKHIIYKRAIIRDVLHCDEDDDSWYADEPNIVIEIVKQPDHVCRILKPPVRQAKDFLQVFSRFKGHHYKTTLDLLFQYPLSSPTVPKESQQEVTTKEEGEKEEKKEEEQTTESLSGCAFFQNGGVGCPNIVFLAKWIAFKILSSHSEGIALDPNKKDAFIDLILKNLEEIVQLQRQTNQLTFSIPKEWTLTKPQRPDSWTFADNDLFLEKTEAIKKRLKKHAGHITLDEDGHWFLKIVKDYIVSFQKLTTTNNNNNSSEQYNQHSGNLFDCIEDQGYVIHDQDSAEYLALQNVGGQSLCGRALVLDSFYNRWCKFVNHFFSEPRFVEFNKVMIQSCADWIQAKMTCQDKDTDVLFYEIDQMDKWLCSLEELQRETTCKNQHFYVENDDEYREIEQCPFAQSLDVQHDIVLREGSTLSDVHIRDRVCNLLNNSKERNYYFNAIIPTFKKCITQYPIGSYEYKHRFLCLSKYVGSTFLNNVFRHKTLCYNEQFGMGRISMYDMLNRLACFLQVKFDVLRNHWNGFCNSFSRLWKYHCQKNTLTSFVISSNSGASGGRIDTGLINSFLPGSKDQFIEETDDLVESNRLYNQMKENFLSDIKKLNDLVNTTISSASERLFKFKLEQFDSVLHDIKKDFAKLKNIKAVLLPQVPKNSPAQLQTPTGSPEIELDRYVKKYVGIIREANCIFKELTEEEENKDIVKEGEVKFDVSTVFAESVRNFQSILSYWIEKNLYPLTNKRNVLKFYTKWNNVEYTFDNLLRRVPFGDTEETRKVIATLGEEEGKEERLKSLDARWGGSEDAKFLARIYRLWEKVGQFIDKKTKRVPSITVIANRPLQEETEIPDCDPNVTLFRASRQSYLPSSPNGFFWSSPSGSNFTKYSEEYEQKMYDTAKNSMNLGRHSDHHICDSDWFKDICEKSGVSFEDTDFGTQKSEFLFGKKKLKKGEFDFIKLSQDLKFELGEIFHGIDKRTKEPYPDGGHQSNFAISLSSTRDSKDPNYKKYIVGFITLGRDKQSTITKEAATKVETLIGLLKLNADRFSSGRVVVFKKSHKALFERMTSLLNVLVDNIIPTSGLSIYIDEVIAQNKEGKLDEKNEKSVIGALSAIYNDLYIDILTKEKIFHTTTNSKEVFSSSSTTTTNSSLAQVKLELLHLVSDNSGSGHHHDMYEAYSEALFGLIQNKTAKNLADTATNIKSDIDMFLKGPYVEAIENAKKNDDVPEHLKKKYRAQSWGELTSNIFHLTNIVTSYGNRSFAQICREYKHEFEKNKKKYNFKSQNSWLTAIILNVKNALDVADSHKFGTGDLVHAKDSIKKLKEISKDLEHALKNKKEFK